MKIIKNFFQKYEKYLTPLALAGGFVIDNLTLRRADLFFENLLLGIYFLIVLIGIALYHKFESKKQKSVSHLEYQSIIFLITQFAFGGLFSSLTVFYIKSSWVFASWPFLILLFGGMIATEYFKKHFTQFIVQIATLYILLFTYLILLIPLATRSINTPTFILSGILSLIVIFGYIFLFYIYVPNLIQKKEKIIIGMIGIIFGLMNILYFTNIIPPIPLILKDSGIYQNIKRQNREYLFTSFERDFSWKNLTYSYVISENTPVYFYSSVYAPVSFKQKIIHEWQTKDKTGDWKTISKIPFLIIGGSEIGYRGYTISNKIKEGEYRVLVKTEKGQVIGGESFLVK